MFKRELSLIALFLSCVVGSTSASAVSSGAIKSFNKNNLPVSLVQVRSTSASKENIDEISRTSMRLIEKMAARGIAFLSDKDMTKSQREKEFRKLINENFDMKTIGRFALGRYWRSSSPKERKEYLKLFKEMIIHVYTKRFGDYNGEKLVVTSARREGKSDVIVSSSIITQRGQNISVDWRVRYKKGNYKVIDVIIEGVSMSLTQRSDFASVIQRGGGNVKVLLDHLRNS